MYIVIETEMLYSIDYLIINLVLFHQVTERRDGQEHCTGLLGNWKISSNSYIMMVDPI